MCWYQRKIKELLFLVFQNHDPMEKSISFNTVHYNYCFNDCEIYLIIGTHGKKTRSQIIALSFSLFLSKNRISEKNSMLGIIVPQTLLRTRWGDLCLLVAYQLWRARNWLIFQQGSVSAVSLISAVLDSVKDAVASWRRTPLTKQN